MMKPRGTWIAVCMILAVGFFSTDYVKKKTTGIAETTAAATVASYDLAERMPEYKETGKSPAGLRESVKRSDTQPGEDTRPLRIATASETGAASLTADSESVFETAESGHEQLQAEIAPLSEEAFAMEEGQEHPALIRLQELDEQIARNQAGKSETTTSFRKASAENEWRLWETELQRILGVLKEKLDEKAQESLMYDQIEWMKNREETSVDASKKQMGSAMEEVNYNRSRAELTRARVYALTELYGELLTE